MVLDGDIYEYSFKNSTAGLTFACVSYDFYCLALSMRHSLTLHRLNYIIKSYITEGTRLIK
jgi:hypothetical protein